MYENIFFSKKFQAYFPRKKDLHFLSGQGFCPPTPLTDLMSDKNVVLCDGSPHSEEMFNEPKETLYIFKVFWTNSIYKKLLNCRLFRNNLWVRKSLRSNPQNKPFRIIYRAFLKIFTLYVIKAQCRDWCRLKPVFFGIIHCI